MTNSKPTPIDLSLRHDTGTELFFHLIDALRPHLSRMESEPCDWDYLVNPAARQVTDFYQIRRVIPKVIHELAEACRSEDWEENQCQNVRSIFCRHLLVQLKLRTAALADFAVQLKHPDQDLHYFLSTQSEQIDRLVQLIEHLNERGWFEGCDLTAMEMPLTVPEGAGVA